MDYAYEIRRQAEAAPRAALPAVASAMWKAFGKGHLSEAEAEALSGLIEARQANVGTHAPKPLGSPRSRAGSRPRTDASMERRRRWAASGRLPPGLATRFTLAEQAVLAVVAGEVAKRGDCRLALDHIAALAGVSRATVRNAIRQAKVLGLVTVEERRQSRFRNDTNVVCIVSREWTSWLRLARKGVTDRYYPGGNGVADHHPHAGRAKKNLGRQGGRETLPPFRKEEGVNP
ncbi:helix-turn-helix domain-containing protein [Methylobacterium sp. HMF5984]|uniref:helix-turn-helix domain-containing protein n=1 Tax=Methylobacterium sp. HMF5984 TaxID=3367370 RepID=UPI00385451EB